MFNIFIYFSSLHVSGIHMPITRRKIAVSIRHWYLSLCMCGVWSAIQPAEQTAPIQSDKYQCRLDTEIFSWWWTHGCPKHV